jgi:hypothetical protein
VIQETLVARSEAPLSGTLELRVEPRLWPRQETEAWLRDTLRSPRHFVEIRTVTEGEAALRAALEKRAQDDLSDMRQAWAIDVAILLGAAIVFVGSFAVLVRHLRHAQPRTHLRSLSYALLLDAVVFLVALTVVATSLTSPVWRGPNSVALLAPLAILVALGEMLTFGVARARGWGAERDRAVAG